MAAPIVTWLQVEYEPVETDPTRTQIKRVVHPMTVLAAYNAGILGNTTQAQEFKNSYGSKPLWDAGIVEAGKFSEPQIGEFLLCNNLTKDPGGTSDPIADMIHVTLNVTDRKGESNEKDICGETLADRQATLKFRLFQKTGATEFKWGIYDRDDSLTWKDLNTTGTSAGQAMVSSALPLEVTYQKSQVVNAIDGGTITNQGGTIKADPANWSGTGPDTGEYFDSTTFKAGNFAVPDSKNYARMQFLLDAKPTAEAGTILFIIRANYQYT